MKRLSCLIVSIFLVVQLLIGCNEAGGNAGHTAVPVVTQSFKQDAQQVKPSVTQSDRQGKKDYPTGREFAKQTDKLENAVRAVGIPENIVHPAKSGRIPYGCITAYVTRVIDGDTIVVMYKSKKYRVRLLDIDTPESSREGLPVQEFAHQASEYTKSLVLNRTVKLVFQKELRDKYGRLLAYVIANGNVFVNALLVRNGFARIEVLQPNDDLLTYFKRLQEIAISERAGLWSLPKERQPFVRDSSGEYVPRYWKDRDVAQ